MTYYCFVSNFANSYKLIDSFYNSSRIELNKRELFYSYITAHLNKLGLSFVELLYPTQSITPELKRLCIFLENIITKNYDYKDDIIMLTILFKIKPEKTINYIKQNSNYNTKIKSCFVLWYHNKNEYCLELLVEIPFESIEDKQTALSFLAAKTLSTNICEHELITVFKEKFPSFLTHNDFNLVLDSELLYYSILLKHLNKISHLLLFIRALHQRTLIHGTPKFFNFLFRLIS